MTSVLEYIEQLRERPHHERKRIAVGTSLGISIFIAIVWLGISLSTGAFQVQGTSFAAATGEASATIVAGENTSNSANLAGAAAATAGYSSAPSIQVVDSPSAPAAQPEKTVIPF